MIYWVYMDRSLSRLIQSWIWYLPYFIVLLFISTAVPIFVLLLLAIRRVGEKSSVYLNRLRKLIQMEKRLAFWIIGFAINTTLYFVFKDMMEKPINYRSIIVSDRVQYGMRAYTNLCFTINSVLHYISIGTSLEIYKNRSHFMTKVDQHSGSIRNLDTHLAQKTIKPAPLVRKSLPFGLLKLLRDEYIFSYFL